MDFILEEKAHGMARKFSPNHGNLENYNVRLINEKVNTKLTYTNRNQKSINAKVMIFFIKTNQKLGMLKVIFLLPMKFIVP